MTAAADPPPPRTPPLGPEPGSSRTAAAGVTGDGPERRLPRAFSSLSVRNYRLYFWGYAVSIAGTWMQTLALAFLVLRLTGSGADLGIATAARYLPLALLGPFGGLVTAGRGNPRRSSTLALAAAGWGVAITAAALAPTLPWELVALLFVGYGSISFNALSKTALQLAAAPAMRGRVMALWAPAWGGTTVIGGPLVGCVAQDIGSRWSLVIGGSPTILLGILMLPALRRIDHPAPPGASA